MTTKDKSLQDAALRFWNKVRKSNDPDGCWEWTASTNSDGYGQFKYQLWPIKAHRFAWMLETGEDPGHELILHKCDNRICVRFDHLYRGSARDNVWDMVRRDRVRNNPPRGSAHSSAKLDEEKIREIRSKYNRRTYSSVKLAVEYGVSERQIRSIVRGKSWTHVS